MIKVFHKLSIIGLRKEIRRFLHLSTKMSEELPVSKEVLTESDESIINHSTDSKDSEASSQTDKVKKKKCVMLLAYCGQGYLGMQRNPPYKTIEDDILVAMWKSGLISNEDMKTPQRISFQRASRTDKGVSAVRQVLSLKLGFENDTVTKINDNLPEQIRVFDIRRVTKRFDAKISCNYRTYSYLCPSFALAPNADETTEDYRVTPEIIAICRERLQQFKGTRNFHNYTSGKKPNEASAHRYIIDFQCSDPFVREGVEFVNFMVKGQSFMMHQIRKMIGVVIAVVRGVTTPDIFEKTWKPVRVDIPKAPGLGLMLEEVHYDAYNRRFSGDGMHEALEWSAYQDAIQDYKEKQILPAIIKGEKEEKSMLQWLCTLELHSYDVREPGPNDRIKQIKLEPAKDSNENKRKETSDYESEPLENKKLKVDVKKEDVNHEALSNNISNDEKEPSSTS